MGQYRLFRTHLFIQEVEKWICWDQLVVVVEKGPSEGSLHSQTGYLIHSTNITYFLAPIFYMAVWITLHCLLKTFPKYHSKLPFQVLLQKFVACPVYEFNHKWNNLTAKDCHMLTANMKKTHIIWGSFIFFFFFQFLSLKIIFKSTQQLYLNSFVDWSGEETLEESFTEKRGEKIESRDFKQKIYIHIYLCIA